MASASIPNPTEVKMLPVQQTILDLNTFEDVLTFKDVPFTPVSNTEDALARLNNDATRFLKVINDGLRAETQRTAKSDPSIPWLVKDDEGNKVPFDGIPADSLKVNSVVLNIAKSVFGYNKDMTSEQKAAAKESAVSLIKSNSVMLEGLKKNAAIVAELEGE